MLSCAPRASPLAIPLPLWKSIPTSSRHSDALPTAIPSPPCAMISPSFGPKVSSPSFQIPAAISFSPTDTRSAWSSLEMSRASLSQLFRGTASHERGTVEHLEDIKEQQRVRSEHSSWATYERRVNSLNSET